MIKRNLIKTMRHYHYIIFIISIVFLQFTVLYQLLPPPPLKKMYIYIRFLKKKKKKHVWDNSGRISGKITRRKKFLHEGAVIRFSSVKGSLYRAGSFPSCEGKRDENPCLERRRCVGSSS